VRPTFIESGTCPFLADLLDFMHTSWFVEDTENGGNKDDR